MRFGLSEKNIRSINGIFSRHRAIKEVIIYGSRAIGNYRPGSDIDLVILSDGLDYSDLKKIENEIDDLMLPYTVDLSEQSKIENPDLLDHIARVGKSFYLR